MITSVTVQHLRGVGQGALTDMAPLTVLMGPNGSGKSTFLEALLIGVSPSPAHMVGEVVRRRRGALNGADFLFTRNGTAAAIEIVAHPAESLVTELALEMNWMRVPRALLAGLEKPRTAIQTKRGGGEALTVFGLNNEFKVRDEREAVGVPTTFVRLIDPSQDLVRSPVELFSTLLKLGRKASVLQALQAVVGDGLRDVMIMTAGERPYLALELAEGAVPVSLAGDGVHSLTRLLLELANFEEGDLALLEEPEVHAHSRTLTQLAKVIWSTVARGVQVVLTTHSLELLDALVSEAPPAQLDQMAALRLRLSDGDVRSMRVSGSQIAQLREDFAEDLR